MGVPGTAGEHDDAAARRSRGRRPSGPASRANSRRDAGRRAGRHCRLPSRASPGRGIPVRHTALDNHHAMVDLVDAVTIAVPTVLHREVAGPFLSRGIATLVEKPMASSAAESERLVDDARAAVPCCRLAISSGSIPPWRARRDADPPQVRECRTALDVHVPVDRYWCRARPHDPRPGSAARAHQFARAIGCGGRREPLRRPRGRRQCPDRIRGRQYRERHCQPRQLHAHPQDAHLGCGRIRLA